MTTTRALFTTASLLGLLAGWFGFDLRDYEGDARWESTTVTITADLEKYADAWGDTLNFKVAPASEAQITTRVAVLESRVGGVAHMTYHDGNYLASCTIDIDSEGTDPARMTHEFGHCLGLGHEHHTAGTNMHWFATDYQAGWSDTVTDWDRDNLALLYTPSS